MIRKWTWSRAKPGRGNKTISTAEKGNAKAQYRMGIFYKEGQGVEKSYTEAKNWLRKAALQGYSKAIEELRSIEDSIKIE